MVVEVETLEAIGKLVAGCWAGREKENCVEFGGDVRPGWVA